MKATLSPLWVTVCVAAVWGPYLVSGLRTEQLAFYGSATIIVMTQRSSLRTTLAPARWVLILWLAYASIAVVGGLVAVENETPWDSGSLLAGLDNALLPLATIITVSHWCAHHSMETILAASSRVLVVAMSANAVVALVGCLLGLDSMPWLSRFWAAGGTSTYVAELAEQMGRFSGIFNQPAEAGIAYTLAALSLAYLQRRGLVAPLWANLAWVLLVVGGLLTLSKVFVGGLVLAVCLVLLYRRRAIRTTVVVLGTVATMVGLTVSGWWTSWGASIMTSWYRYSIAVGDSPLYTLTAGRFGTAGTDGPPSIAVPMQTGEGPDIGQAMPAGVGSLMRELMNEHPVLGLGARGLQVAYDSAWSEALVVGGLVGLSLVVLVHVVIVAGSVARMRRLDSVHDLLLGAVVVLVLAGSMGMPALTGNRESTLLWIWIIVLGFAGRLATGLEGQERAETVAPVPSDEDGSALTTRRRSVGSRGAAPQTE